MKVRYKKSGDEGYSGKFNTHALAEVIVSGDWGGDSAFTSDLEVFLPNQNVWKDMNQAFKDRDIITDNYNTCFFEPKNEEDRKRGYTL